MTDLARQNQQNVIKEEEPPQKSLSTLVSKNVTIDGRRTSVRLEPAMWNGLQDICSRERASIHVICSAIAHAKQARTSLTAAVRVFIVSYYRAATTEDGHTRSSHGQKLGPTAMNAFVRHVIDPEKCIAPSYLIGSAYTGKRP